MADQKIAPPMRLADTSTNPGSVNTAAIDSSGNLSIKLNSVGSVTVPISGSVTANIGTSGSLALDASVTALQVSVGSTTSGQKGGLIMGAVTTSAPTYTTAQTNPLSLTTTGSLRVDIGTNGTVAATQSGAWNITNISGTISLPTGAATSAKQPALGTAGSAASDVITVQGIASMTALKVDGTGGTFPISGSITSAGNVTNAGTFAVQDSQVIVDNAAFTDGTSKLFIHGFIYDEVAGTALTENDAAAARINVNRAIVHALEDGTTRGRYATVTSSNALKIDGSAVTQPISASSLPLPTGAATSAKQPTLGTAGSAASDVISIQGVAGMTAVKVDGSGVTQPISGSISLSDALIDGASAGSTKALIVAGKDGSGNAQMLLTDTAGNLNVNVVSGGGGGGDTPSSPITVYTTASSLAAGSATTTAHQTSDLASGTYYCAGFDVASSVPIKAALYTVLNGTQSSNPIVVIFVQAGDFGQWKPSHRQYVPFTSAGAAGFDGFRVVVTNMDGSEAADTYSTIYYQSN